MVSVALWRNALTHRLGKVPVVTLMPHSRCNCRCIMCDIWKANRGGTSLAEETVKRLLADFKALGVQWVVLSGGEALMHPNLWALCAELKTLPVKITLLSSGLLLARHAEAIADWCDEVIVSLDGTQAIHNGIRGVTDGYQAIVEGVAALRWAKPGFSASARCVVQRRNFRDLRGIVSAAKSIGLDRISFLAADVSSSAFNRPEGWTQDRVEDVGLSVDESEEFANLVEELIVKRAEDFSSGFIAENPERMRKIAAYFRAIHHASPFPEVACNAPWVSTVVESDGTVRPCFFHPPLGNVRDASLPDILNSERAVAFRRTLDMRRDPVCSRCVCTLKL